MPLQAPTVLRPNACIDDASSVAPTGQSIVYMAGIEVPGATPQQRADVLADNDIAQSYHHCPADRVAAGCHLYRFTFPDLNLPAGNRVKWVQARAQMQMVADAYQLVALHWHINNGGRVVDELLAVTRDGSAHEAKGLQLSRIAPAPGQSTVPWTKALVDGVDIGVRVSDPFISPSQPVNVNELYLDVQIDRRPTVNITVPAEAAVVVDPSPTITWDFVDPDGDPQERVEVKVYRQPQGGWPAGSEPPANANPVYSTTVTSSTTRSVEAPIGVADNGEYRAYVRASQPWHDTTDRFWSSWDHVTFDMLVTRPATPTVEALGQATWRRNRITVSAIDVDAELVAVQYLDDDGVWQHVRGAAEVARAGTTMEFDDYEVPPNTPRVYRAYVVDTDGGVEASSLPSEEVRAEYRTRRWQVKDVADATLNIEPRVLAPFDVDRPRQSTVTWPIGARRPVVNVGSGRAAAFPLTVQTDSPDDYDALLAMTAAEPARTLLIQSPLGRQWYVKVTGERESLLRATPPDGSWEHQMGLGSRHLHRHTVDVQEVSRPDVGS